MSVFMHSQNKGNGIVVYVTRNAHCFCIANKMLRNFTHPRSVSFNFWVSPLLSNCFLAGIFGFNLLIVYTLNTKGSLLSAFFSLMILSA